jgi:23S rRNA pseudouridine1911/1915/1917 synthase
MNQEQEYTDELQEPEEVESAEQEPSIELAEEASDLEDDSVEDKSGGDEWYEQQEFVADQKQSLVRLDKFLMDRLSNRSRSKVQDAIRAGSVKVDNLDVKPNYKVKPGNLISIVLPKSLEEEHSVDPQNIPLSIVYEDDEVMVVNKPYNMAVHPGVGIPNGTLVNAVAWHLREQLGELPIKAGNEADRAGIVHRIDKDTTGLMVVAKKEYAMVHLANQFFHHTIERRYWALVWGDPAQDSGTVIGNIGRNPNDRKVFMVFPEADNGKYAVTHWRVLERFYYVTLIECQLETGRTHQIRVHMKYIGHTLFGDPRYGGNQILKGTLYSKYRQFVEGLLGMLPRQALHAKVLGFTHPRTGEHVRFESDLPADMQNVINKWREYVHTRKQQL